MSAIRLPGSAPCCEGITLTEPDSRAHWGFHRQGASGPGSVDHADRKPGAPGCNVTCTTRQPVPPSDRVCLHRRESRFPRSRHDRTQGEQRSPINASSGAARQTRFIQALGTGPYGAADKEDDVLRARNILLDTSRLELAEKDVTDRAAMKQQSTLKAPDVRSMLGSGTIYYRCFESLSAIRREEGEGRGCFLGVPC